MNYIIISAGIILIASLIICVCKIKKQKAQIEYGNANLTNQKRLYSEMISKAKNSDPLGKLRRMKIPHYKALQHINSIIRDNYYKIIPPHKQPKIMG